MIGILLLTNMLMIVVTLERNLNNKISPPDPLNKEICSGTSIKNISASSNETV